jgi:5-methylcytosine-specific restriction endonuclease McrA
MDNEFKMKTLKLDLTYRPVGVIDCLEALVLCIVGKATAVEEYEEEVSSPSITFKIPSVIVLKTVVKYVSQGFRPSRNNIIWRDHNKCQYCATTFNTAELTLDHIIPRSRGGGNTWTNLVACCKKCNQVKRDRTPEEAEMKLIRKPLKPRNSVLRNATRIEPVWNIYLW